MAELKKVKNITDDLIEEFRLSKNDLLFEYILDEKRIGYAVIRDKQDNQIFIIIANDYQNQGYGNALFKELLTYINRNVTLVVPIENIKMQRIIQNNQGIEIGRNGKEILYIIKIYQD